MNPAPDTIWLRRVPAAVDLQCKSLLNGAELRRRFDISRTIPRPYFAATDGNRLRNNVFLLVIEDVPQPEFAVAAEVEQPAEEAADRPADESQIVARITFRFAACEERLPQSGSSFLSRGMIQ